MRAMGGKIVFVFKPQLLDEGLAPSVTLVHCGRLHGSVHFLSGAKPRGDQGWNEKSNSHWIGLIRAKPTSLGYHSKNPPQSPLDWQDLHI
jgi:hypothetical protein